MADSLDDLSGADFINVSDLCDRFEELESERENLTASLEEAREERVSNPAGEESALDSVIAEREAAVTAWDASDDGEEFAKLRAILDELNGSGGDHQWRGDWYPATLIRESHFKDYAQELAEEIGAINSDASWPNNCIDWEKAADELRVDYSEQEVEGRTYLYR